MVLRELLRAGANVPLTLPPSALFVASDAEQSPFARPCWLSTDDCVFHHRNAYVPLGGYGLEPMFRRKRGLNKYKAVRLGVGLRVRLIGAD